MSTLTTPEDERLTYSIPEAARLLGLSKSTAYRAVESGDLPAIRLRGRLLVPRALLMQMLEQNRGHGEMKENDLDPEVAEALDERSEWIARAFVAVREHGPAVLGPLIDEIPDEHLRSMIFVLMLQRDKDHKNVTEMLAMN